MPEYIQYDPASTPVGGKIINKYYSADPSVVDGLSNILQVSRPVFRSLTQYHIVDGDAVREMTQQEKDDCDAAVEVARIARIRGEAKTPMDNFTNLGLLLRALADIIKDEINILRSQHGLPERTLAQLKQAIKNKVDSGDVD